MFLTRDGSVLDRSIAGDFSKFDKSMSAEAIYAGFQVLMNLSRASGNFSEADMLVQRGIATDLSQPVVDYHGDVAMFFGGNSSGHPLTVIINSIVNCLYMRIAYARLTGKPPSDFRRDVRLITLGDDNLMVSDVDEFNHTAIAGVMESCNIGYTMADKSSESRAFVHMDEVDFLKRRFTRVEDRVVGPLDLESTYKSLVCYQARGIVTQAEQSAQCYLAARREWSLHGPEVFNDLVSKVHPILTQDDDIRHFFVRRHDYDWRQTFDWVTQDVEPEEEEKEPVNYFPAPEVE